MSGLISYGAYLPRHRLSAAARAGVLGGAGGDRRRCVASYDEDTTTMAVEAARIALRGLPTPAQPERLYFATACPAYLDKTNATVVHAALGLGRSALAVDTGCAPRSAVAAVLAAAEAAEPALAVLADLRTGLAGSAEEIESGDAAAALLFGPGTAGAPVLAEVIATGWATEEYLDRWRIPGEATSKVWEERFGEQVSAPLALESFAAAIKRADLTPDQIDHLVVCGLAGRAAKRFTNESGVPRQAVVPDRANRIGNTGTAALGVQLAGALDRARSGQTIAVVMLADGAATLILRTTQALSSAHRPRPTVTEQVESGHSEVSYANFLSWRGQLTREPPRRPEPDGPAAPPTFRSRHYKYGFIGTRCQSCDTVQVPPARVCHECGAIDRMSPHPMADVPATVATFTVDRLAFTPSPPMLAAVVDFDGGGRFRCEVTDADPGTLAIGDRVELTFRKLFTSNGVHNYFWKARPARSADTEGQQS